MKVMQILPFMKIGGVERGVLDLAKFFKGRELLTDKQNITNIVVPCDKFS